MAVVLTLAALLSCVPTEDQPPIGEEIPPEPLFILMDAFRGNEQYFLRYRRGDQVYYAAGDLSTQLNTPAEESLLYDVPTIDPMEPLDPGSWQWMTQNMQPIPILQVAEWADLRARLFGELMPREPNQGVVVSFDRVDYFFFFDKNGIFHFHQFLKAIAKPYGLP